MRGLNTEAAALGPRPAQSSQLTLRRFAQVLLGSEKLALGPDVLKTFVVRVRRLNACAPASTAAPP